MNHQTEFTFFQGQIITANFNGGDITSDAGLLAIREFESRLGLIEKMADCIAEWRNEIYVVHPITEMLNQRVFGAIAGYEDCNDADYLRKDPTFKVIGGRSLCPEDALSSQPTLCRLENQVTRQDIKGMKKQMVYNFLDSFTQAPDEIVLDIDSTDDPTHGHQQLTLFHGFYEQYQYYPLIISSNQHVLAAVLRPGTCGSSYNVRSILRVIIRMIRTRFPKVKIILRADAGFSCPELYEFLEKTAGITYYVGIGSNETLKGLAKDAELAVAAAYAQTQIKQRTFSETAYAAATWKEQKRRLIIKTEYQSQGPNTRFIVTNDAERSGEASYDFYAERGRSEQWIGEFKNGFKADRLSCHRFIANQFRLLIYAMAYQIINLFRASILSGTELCNATIDTIRKTIIKIGAQVKQTVRRIWFNMASGCPYQDLFATLHQKILALG